MTGPRTCICQKEWTDQWKPARTHDVYFKIVHLLHKVVEGTGCFLLWFAIVFLVESISSKFRELFHDQTVKTMGKRKSCLMSFLVFLCFRNWGDQFGVVYSDLVTVSDVNNFLNILVHILKKNVVSHQYGGSVDPLVSPCHRKIAVLVSL